MRRSLPWALVGSLGLLVGAAPLEEPQGEALDSSACIACHLELDGPLAAPAEVWPSDAHALAGLPCHACHGGDPSPELAEDPEASMSAEAGFRAAPGRLQIADSCARCHSDASFMRQFDPQARVDQLAEYRVSVHGMRNLEGDPVPATCTDCHGAHGIRPVSSPDSPVHATNVPRTCARCHSDAAMMASYGLSSDQFEEYMGSIHALVLLELGDVAAPACNDCHGNHGAAPPGVQAVANVCGQCHGREATLFRESFKKELFDAMDVAECTVCHDHHRVRHPSPELFHGGSAPQVSTGTILETDPFRAELGQLPAGAEARASWIALLKPHVAGDDDRLLHRVEVAAAGLEPLVLDATVRPGTSTDPLEPRRILSDGLTVHLEIEPSAGMPVAPGDALRFRLRVAAGLDGPAREVFVRDLPGEALQPLSGSACLTCHSPGDVCDRETERMYGALTALERALRGAGSSLRRAELSGMEVGEARFQLGSQGTTAAVEARALIHTFDPERVLERTAEGAAVAVVAQEAADAAFAEMQVRRRGLAVSLLLVAVVLLGLFLKIRQVDRERREATGPGPGG